MSRCIVLLFLFASLLCKEVDAFESCYGSLHTGMDKRSHVSTSPIRKLAREKRFGTYAKLGMTHMTLFSIVKRLSITLAAIIISTMPSNTKDKNLYSQRDSGMDGRVGCAFNFQDKIRLLSQPDSTNQFVLIKLPGAQSSATAESGNHGLPSPVAAIGALQSAPSAAVATGAFVTAGAVVGGRALFRRKEASSGRESEGTIGALADNTAPTSSGVKAELRERTAHEPYAAQPAVGSSATSAGEVMHQAGTSPAPAHTVAPAAHAVAASQAVATGPTVAMAAGPAVAAGPAMAAGPRAE